MAFNLKEILRFGIVGIAHNSFGYLFYLGITWGGVMTPKLAMSVLYAVGVLMSFYLNRNWVFRHDGPHGNSFIKCLAAYGVGYAVNLATFYFMVDRFHWRHEVVQGMLVFIVGGIIFVLFRYWVFPRNVLLDQH